MFANIAKFAKFADFPLPGTPSDPGPCRCVPHPHASESKNTQGRTGGHSGSDALIPHDAVAENWTIDDIVNRRTGS
jgi:hypothetical protein